MGAAAAKPPLKDVLADVARVCPGVGEALLVDGQGMLVERFIAAAGGPDPEELAVETMAAALVMGRVAGAGRLGRPAEWVLAAERGTLVVRRIAVLDLFLILRIPLEEWIGRARFAARITAGRIVEALA
ncbi:MAG: hypothetical protein ABFD84_06650 [Candidatus Polarisedimenticolia bacterium]|nr:hypothetical protein [bacterium]